MIKALFLKSDKIGARLISFGTKRDGQTAEDTPSHVAFLFFDTIIIDSTLSNGVREVSLGYIKDHYRIINCIELPVSEEETYRYLEKARGEILGARYDWAAIAYFSWRVLLNKIGIPFPKKNKLNFKNKYFCTEVYSIITGERYGIVSPNDLLLKMIEKKYIIIGKEV